ncbi:hypothetical protein JK208_01655 [Gluconobacter sp. Dm-74]|uniref:hypothetical protein n=1 Tax=Gluconobacter sp. Dm-74 TaxID=2799803 RepID=UPI001B8B0AF8|nr:hypothetical protein [Gluconobacter sp. Dm-74]MBS1090318.1 hypothetical protein [Gluconobacter sp. Dm-74]
MANIDRSIFRLPFIGGAVAVLLVLGAGGAFLRLGMTATPPEQTMVHKDLSGAAFASSAAPQAELPAMPPVPTTQTHVAPVAASGTTPAAPVAAPAAAPLTPSTPLPTMPAPKAAPVQSMPAPPASAPAH